MEVAALAALGAGMGMLVGFWNNLKGVIQRIGGLFVQRVQIFDREIIIAVTGYCNTHLQRSVAYTRLYRSAQETIQNANPMDDRVGIVPYESFDTANIIFWKRWLPLFFYFTGSKSLTSSGGSGKSDGLGDVTSGGSDVLCLAFLRGTFDIDEIIRAATNRYNQMRWHADTAVMNEGRRYQIVTYPGDWNTMSSINRVDIGFVQFANENVHRLLNPEGRYGNRNFGIASQLQSLYFPPAVDEVIQHVQYWRDGREWHVTHEVPWKMGLLLHGKPGTGKSALVRAIGFDLNMPIFVFQLAQMDNRTLGMAWKRMRNGLTPAIALFEDIDTIFNGRENIVRRPANTIITSVQQQHGTPHTREDDWMARDVVTFEYFINLLDGVDTNDGILTIITTNKIDSIDAAMGCPSALPTGNVADWTSTRPGRIDRAVELGNMRTEDKRRMAQRILGDLPDAMAIAEAAIAQRENVDETPAQVQEWLTRIARRTFWTKRQATSIPQAILAEHREHMNNSGRETHRNVFDLAKNGNS